MRVEASLSRSQVRKNSELSRAARQSCSASSVRSCPARSCEAKPAQIMDALFISLKAANYFEEIIFLPAPIKLNFCHGVAVVISMHPPADIWAKVRHALVRLN